MEFFEKEISPLIDSFRVIANMLIKTTYTNIHLIITGSVCIAIHSLINSLNIYWLATITIGFLATAQRGVSET